MKDKRYIAAFDAAFDQTGRLDNYGAFWSPFRFWHNNNPCSGIYIQAIYDGSAEIGIGTVFPDNEHAAAIRVDDEWARVKLTSPDAVPGAVSQMKQVWRALAKV